MSKTEEQLQLDELIGTWLVGGRHQSLVKHFRCPGCGSKCFGSSQMGDARELRCTGHGERGGCGWTGPWDEVVWPDFSSDPSKADQLRRELAGAGLAYLRLTFSSGRAWVTLRTKARHQDGDRGYSAQSKADDWPLALARCARDAIVDERSRGPATIQFVPGGNRGEGKKRR